MATSTLLFAIAVVLLLAVIALGIHRVANSAERIINLLMTPREVIDSGVREDIRLRTELFRARAAEDLQAGDAVRVDAEGAAHQATAAENSATEAVEESEAPMVFGGMPDEERRARRRRTRISNCAERTDNHTSIAARAANGTLEPGASEVTCMLCGGVAPIIRADDKPDTIGEFA